MAIRRATTSSSSFPKIKTFLKAMVPWIPVEMEDLKQGVAVALGTLKNFLSHAKSLAYAELKERRTLNFRISHGEFIPKEAFLLAETYAKEKALEYFNQGKVLNFIYDDPISHKNNPLFSLIFSLQVLIL